MEPNTMLPKSLFEYDRSDRFELIKSNTKTLVIDKTYKLNFVIKMKIFISRLCSGEKF